MPRRSAPSALTAAREGREPDIAGLVNGWGGVTIAYRRRLINSPSYTLNHEEVLKALEEDIRFAEGLSPVAVEVDANGHASALKVGGRAERPRRSRRPCRRAPSWWRRARSPTPCWRARTRRTPSSTASISARSTRRANR